MKHKQILYRTVFAIALIFAVFLIQAQDYKIEVKNIDASKALITKMDVETSQVGPSMGEAYGKLFAFLGQKNVQPTGAPFAVYLKFDPQGNTVYEAGVPVKEKVESTGDVQYKEYPAMKVVSVLHTGSYEKMIPVYEALDKYVKENKLKATGVSWEVYLTDPNETAPEQNQTIIYFPIE